MISENKQRIVGVVVLAAFIALLIPFLFTGGEKKHDNSLDYGKEIELQLSDGNISAGVPSSHVNQTPSEVAIQQENIVLSEVQGNGNGAKLSEEGQGSMLTAPAMDIKKIELSDEILPDSTTNRLDIADSVVRNAKKSPAKVVNNRKVARKSAPKRVGSNARSWSVQVGSFSDHNRVQALSDKLQSNGFLVYLQKIGTNQGSMTRVLVGKEKSREEAMQVAKKLKSRLKLGGNVVVNRL
jgi:cell division septation protein DedD